MSESIPYFLLRSDLNHMKQKDHVLLSKWGQNFAVNLMVVSPYIYQQLHYN